MFSPFTEHDWIGFAGATRFPSGEAPLMQGPECYLTPSNGVLLIADATGFAFIDLDEVASFGELAVRVSLASAADAERLALELFPELANPVPHIPFSRVKLLSTEAHHV